MQRSQKFARLAPARPVRCGWSPPARAFWAVLVVLGALAGPAHAQDEERVPWTQRREELRELDLQQLEDFELEELLIELSQLAGPEDPLAGFDAARAGYVLAARLRDLGEFADARAMARDALEVCPPEGGMRPYLLHLQADLAAYSRDFEGALRLLDEARASLDAEQLTGEISCSILTLTGEVHLSMGVPDRAAGPIFEALARAEGLREAGKPHRGALLDAYIKRANLRMATGSYELLRDEVGAVLEDEELLAGRADVVARLMLRLGIAHLWFARGDDEDARSARGFLEQALGSPKLLELDRLTCHVRLAQLALLTGDLERAGESLVQARAALESMAAREDYRFAPIERAFLAALELRWARRARADEGELVRARRDVLWTEFGRLVEGWSDRPSREGGVGLLRAARTQLVLGEMIAAEFELAEERVAVDALLEALARAQAAGTLAEALGAEDVSAAAVRAHLVPPEGGLVIYVPAPGRSHVIALDEEGVLHARLADARDLRRASEELDLLVRRSPATYADAASRRRRAEELGERSRALAAELWPGELGARLAAWDAVTFVDADLVGELALEVLPVEDGRALGTALAVDHAPGLAAGVALARRGAGRSEEAAFEFDLCLVAGAIQGERLRERFGGLETLPIDEGGIEAWTRPFAPERVLRLIGPDATVAALSAAEPARARSLLLVTHGLRDPALEISAGLMLAADEQHDGGLFSAEVAGLGVSPLVVLAACGAGRGPERTGGDALAANLGGAFLASGADVVVLSSSDMAYRATAEQLRHLNAGLARGLTPAEALRSSRAALVAEGEFDDPYYYGQAQAFGLGHRPLFTDGPEEPLATEERDLDRVMAIGVSVLLSVAALLVMRSRRAEA